MCGISGIVFKDGIKKGDPSLLAKMQKIQHHRGPDDSGIWSGEGCMLASNRLAILDLSERGHMPMSTPDKRYWMTYNGEIYNFKDLKDELMKKGERFISETDTEVLLRLYQREGIAAFSKLNGMFAFAIWDNQERKLILVRDRLGIKPLYYAFHDNGFYFASEAKAFFEAGIDAQWNHETFNELLCFRFVAGEKTPFLGIRKLLPGHYLVFKEGQCEIHRWWNLAQRASEQKWPEPLEDWYAQTFDQAVRMRLISDVPVGVLLSGGLDSTSVAISLAKQTQAKVASFTVGFEDADYNETHLAEETAHLNGLEYHQLIIDWQKIPSLLEQAAWFNDEPLAHGNDLHLYAISKYAKSHVTVLLSGEGADETLGGYLRYQTLHYPALTQGAAYAAFIMNSFGIKSRRIAKLAHYAHMSPQTMILFNASDVYAQDLKNLGLSLEMHVDYREKILKEAQGLYPQDFVRQAMYLDQHTFLTSILERNDRMTMGASIECRVPFLDYRLVEMLAALPTRHFFNFLKGKKILMKALGERLPEKIRKGKKWGFGVPWKKYLRMNKELKSQLEKLPQHPMLQQIDMRKDKLSALIQEFLKGNDRHEVLIRQLFMMTLWHGIYFKKTAQVSLR